jgi:hypothetical protein
MPSSLVPAGAPHQRPHGRASSRLGAVTSENGPDRAAERVITTHSGIVADGPIVPVVRQGRRRRTRVIVRAVAPPATSNAGTTTQAAVVSGPESAAARGVPLALALADGWVLVPP